MVECVVTNRCMFNQITTSLDTTNKELMQRSVHRVNGSQTRLKLMSANFYVDSSLLEKGPGATATVSASVEYPLGGPCIDFVYSGSLDGTIPDAGVLESSYSNIAIPNGSIIGIRQFLRCAGGIVVGAQSTISGDQMVRGVSGIANQTSGGTIAGSASALNFPLGIIGDASQPAICLVGDSVANGLGMSPDSNGERGYIKAFTAFNYVNLAMPTTSLSSYLTHNTQRKKIYQYCSHFLNDLGVGDIFVGGDSVAQVEAKLTTLYNEMYSAFPGSARVFQFTITPVTSTTDACISLDHQTLFVDAPTEAVRVALNTRMRSLAFAPNGGVFDSATVFESSFNSGLWKVTPQYSPDCVHPNAAAYAALISSGAVDTSRITMVPPSWFKRA